MQHRENKSVDKRKEEKNGEEERIDRRKKLMDRSFERRLTRRAKDKSTWMEKREGEEEGG